MLMERAIAIGGWVDRLSQRQALLLAWGILAVTSLLHYACGIEISLGLFYLLPVLIVGWRGSPIFVILTCLLAGTLWDGLSLLLGDRYYNNWVYLWNPCNRVLSYLVTSFLLHRLRISVNRLRALSHLDSMTGLLNSGAFTQALQEELNRQQRTRRPISLAFIDLDHFKQVNDTLGHLRGDQALKTVSVVLRRRLRRTDVVGRMGGDEFAVLMPETNGEGAMAALKIVRRKLLDAMQRQDLPVTFSIGVVTSRGDASPTRMLQQADALMYSVKHDGRDDIRHSDLMIP